MRLGCALDVVALVRRMSARRPVPLPEVLQARRDYPELAWMDDRELMAEVAKRLETVKAPR